ncbi:MAG: type II secretion system protein GspE [Candidatus Omnitrophica bacterium CG_4_9_14_0_2_um_filter_43_12]|nr:MAG: type II secretion system protein GspE [Candidatus Omnitrophica bacterium CG03_land_8_20_14_0_80_43_22]PJC46248.1 MAG: type II secretion system protein GspE [Candidatus Omnitrophica bacterium CG_4_9_14_0_2_um_filter_43_12]
MRTTRLKLGEMLKEAGLLTEEQIQAALKEQKRKKSPIGDIFVELGFISEKDIAETLAIQLEVPFVSGDHGLLKPRQDQDLGNVLPHDVARQYNVLPLSRDNNVLTVAITDPSDLMSIDNLRSVTNCEISPVIATKIDIKKAQDEFYGEQTLLRDAVEDTYKIENIETIDTESGPERTSLDESQAMAEAAPAVKIVDLILLEAIKSRASDIHIEPFEKHLSVRYRIDGELYEVAPPSQQLTSAIVSRFKIMSKMDIAEKRLPQDGAFSLKIGPKIVDFRVSTLPTIFGEKIVIRLLDKASIMFKLEDMGFGGKMLEYYRQAVNRPYGLIFITGPTGSGKSTTLYATLREIATPDKNVITIEDPVEYRLDGINQMQVKTNIGLTFASGVRTSLRQDPDIILVGEVRDLETAQSCVRAALTGHLVLSTLHTNDAASSIVRLKDFGIEPFLIGSSLILIEAQRLVRRLCQKCREPYQPSKEEKEKFNLADTIYKSKGCPECRKSGYKGRIGIYEVLFMTPAIKELVYTNATTVEIKKKAQEEGMASLLFDGISKVNSGLTSMEEVLAAAYE